jgi:O-antigen/teichoic acid export membrane protein
MKHVRALIFSRQMAGWADQIVVSAGNLVVILMLARWAALLDVGYYAVAYSILALAMTTQDSLVTRPFTIQMFKSEESGERHAAGALLFALLLVLGLAATALAVAGALRLGGQSADGVWLAATLAVAIPFVLWKEFARRFSFAHLQPGQALLTDACATAMTTAVLFALASAGHLSAVTALLAMALGCGLAAVAWFAGRRADFHFDRQSAANTIRRSIGLGKWLLSGQIALQAQGYAAHWITLAIGGAVVTGLYSACLSIVALCNPFLFGYFNILTPKFVLVLKDGGAGALRRHAALGSLFLGLVIGAFVLALWMFGSTIMGIMFPGGAYQEGLGILTVLAIATWAGALGGPAGVALMAAEKGRPLAALSAAICVAGSALVLVLMWYGGLAAAAIGILATEALGSLGRWALLLHLLPRERPAAVGGSAVTALS